MAKNLAQKRMESVGWLFFVVTCALLSGPAIYVLFKVKFESTSAAGAVAMGLMLAAIAASVITVSVNTVLQQRSRKRRLAERRKIKK